MLSKHDFAKELGKNLLIYPFFEDALDDSSYSLHAYRYAWELDTKSSAVKSIENRTIITVPPKKTVLIVTKESVSLQQKLNGICCSGVSNTSKGLFVCTTPIKCGWIGRLIIVVYNTTDKEIRINEGEKIAVLLIDRLYSKAKGSAQNQNKKTLLLLSTIVGLSDTMIENDISPENMSSIDKMKANLIQSDEYKKFRAAQPKEWWKFILSLIVIIILIFATGRWLGYDNVLPIALSAVISFILAWWTRSYFT